MSYHQRFNELLDYIDKNLDKKLTIDILCKKVYFSPFHFHRQFSAYVGIPLIQYIQAKRLKKACYQLAFRKELSITQIAYQAAFSNSESFSRAFKLAFNQTPSQYRKQPKFTQSQLNGETFFIRDNNEVNKENNMNNVNHKDLTKVTIVNFPETTIAVYQHRGCPSGLMKSIQNFITWRKVHHLPPSKSATYNLIYDDPSTTLSEEFKFDICAQTFSPIDSNNSGIINSVIPAGQCAKYRHIGSDDALKNSLNFLFKDWLPNHDVELRDFPIILERVTFYPDVPENEAIIDIYLPIT